MPEHNFPKAKLPDKLHVVTPNSMPQSLAGLDQNTSFSSVVQPVKAPWSHSWQDLRPIQKPDVNELLRPLTFHADPIAALRHRDQQALEDIFDGTQVDDMLTDVYLRLKQLHPEPCWEDNSFDFLQGYV